MENQTHAQNQRVPVIQVSGLKKQYKLGQIGGGTLTHDGKIALDEHDDEVTVAPQFFQVHIKPAGARPNNGGPLRIIPGRGLPAGLKRTLWA